MQPNESVQTGKNGQKGELAQVEAEKNVVEGFCNEHWHGVATSVVVVIVIVFIVLSIMIFLSFMKIIEKNCKRNYVKCCTAMTGGNGFAQEQNVHEEDELEGEIF